MSCQSFVPKPAGKAKLRQAILGISASIADADRLTPRLNTHILAVEDNAVTGFGEERPAGSTSSLQQILPPSRSRPTRRGDEERFLGLGFDDYLSKPYRQSQLLAMLTKHLRPAAPADTGASGASGSAAPGETGGPGGADSDTGVLDAQALERLRELDPSGENHLMERVVNAFETSVGRLMPQLQDALNGSELGGIRHVAHTLKSSSASIGAMKLSRMCSDVEARARQEQSEGMPERIAQLQAEVEVVRVALKKILGA